MHPAKCHAACPSCEPYLSTQPRLDKVSYCCQQSSKVSHPAVQHTRHGTTHDHHLSLLAVAAHRDMP